MFKKYLFNKLSILLVGVLLLSNCGGNNQNEGENAEVETPKTEEDLAWEKALAEKEKADSIPLDQNLDKLYTSITELQKFAFESEMTKINSSRSLIEEIEQSIPKYDRATLNKIKADLKEMEATLYNEETLADENLLEEYDIHTDNLIEGWKTFSENTEVFDQHARAVAFYDEIMEANNQDAQIRRNYNIYVHDYNTILSNQANEVKALGEKYTAMKPFLFFYGSDPMVM